MKREIQIYKNTKLITLPNSKCYIEKYFNNLFNEIYGTNEEYIFINEDNGRYQVLKNNKQLCTFKINKYSEIYDFIINIFEEDKEYCYHIIDEGVKIMANLAYHRYTKDGIKYHLGGTQNFLTITITKDKEIVSIQIYMGDREQNNIKDLTDSISLNDTIHDLYNKINIFITDYHKLRIKKSNILNTIDRKEQVTDLIYIDNNELIDYMSTTSNNDKKYVVRKENNNYMLTCINGNVDDFVSSYFLVNDEVKFIKKLEKK